MAVSTAESAVMEALWRHAPLSGEEIIAEVAEAHGWSPATVKTLLNRLLKKKAISAEKQGRRYLYRPQLSQSEYLSAESRGLIDRLFGGRVSALVSHFSVHEQLSDDDVAALKRLITELEDER